jgi:N-methylhydantoinase A/oxoprolinase/acetone carboxylase beta subunit
VADAEMVRALRVMTVERGLDPRAFTLLPFGGAGPLHAAGIAGALGIGRVLVPRASGVLSALGLAAADRRRDEARTVMLRGDGLTAAALREAAGDAAETAWDVRYAGQSHELTLRGVDPEPAAVRAALAAAHQERYGYAEDGADVEVVTVRRTRREPGPALDLGDGPREPARAGPCRIALPGSTLLVPEGWRAGPAPAGCLVLERAA